MFSEAFLSRSFTEPQLAQVHSLSFSVSKWFVAPHGLHIFDDASNWPQRKIFEPYHNALYSINVLNLPIAMSLNACASLWFAIMFFAFKVSRQTVWFSLTNFFVTLCKKSFLWLLTFSCCFARAIRALFLLILPFTFLLTFLCNCFNLFNDFRRCFGFSICSPLLKVANVLIPKSTPTAFLIFAFFDCFSLSLVSTNMDAKYLPVGVLLMVVVFTLPSKVLCKTILIPDFNFGMNNLPPSKSTFAFCGIEKLCLLSCFDLKRGNPFLSLKKRVNALSKFSKLACNV